MFQGTVEAQELRQMPSEYQELVMHLLVLHAEGELTGSDMYTQSFFPLAPNAKERYVCCRLAAEEVDHFIKTAKVLAEIEVDCSYMLGQDIMERNRFPLEAVRFEFRTWEDRAAFSALAEYVGHYQIENMGQSSYLPLRRIVPGILAEEDGHARNGWRILKELCADEEGRQRAQRAVNRWFPIALDAFGRSASVRTSRYVEWGIKAETNEALRSRFIPDASARLEALGLTVPDPNAERKFT